METNLIAYQPWNGNKYTCISICTPAKIPKNWNKNENSYETVEEGYYSGIDRSGKSNWKFVLKRVQLLIWTRAKISICRDMWDQIQKMEIANW